MGNRRFARPENRPAAGSIQERLATALVPQYAQTGVGANSTDVVVLNMLTVTGSATVQNLAVSSSFTVQSSALKSMAFLSATGAAAIMANSSWLNGPVTSTLVTSTNIAISGGSITGTPISGSSGSFTNFIATGTVAFGTFTADVVAAILGYVTILSATGGTIRLAAVST